MKMTIQFLTSKIKYIVLIYVVIQLILILTIDISYKSDSLYYYKLAQECSVSNEYYPAKAHLYEDYIVAPLYINVLICSATNNSVIHSLSKYVGISHSKLY
jgi:hypothetical protein